MPTYVDFSNKDMRISEWRMRHTIDVTIGKHRLKLVGDRDFVEKSFERFCKLIEQENHKLAKEFRETIKEESHD